MRPLWHPKTGVVSAMRSSPVVDLGLGCQWSISSGCVFSAGPPFLCIAQIDAGTNYNFVSSLLWPLQALNVLGVRIGPEAPLVDV